MNWPIKKGNWYYEIQILMWVIMWQHDLRHIPHDSDGFRWGRLHIWYDTCWLRHGFSAKIYRNIRSLKLDTQLLAINIRIKIRKIHLFFLRKKTSFLLAKYRFRINVLNWKYHFRLTYLLQKNRILHFWRSLTLNVNHFKRPQAKLRVLLINIKRMAKLRKTTRNKFRLSFLRSMFAFLKLSKAGFRISYSKSEVVDLEIYRLFWRGKIMDNMGDIDCVDGIQYAVMLNGASIPLSHKEEKHER